MQSMSSDIRMATEAMTEVEYAYKLVHHLPLTRLDFFLGHENVFCHLTTGLFLFASEGNIQHGFLSFKRLTVAIVKLLAAGFF